MKPFNFFLLGALAFCLATACGKKKADDKKTYFDKVTTTNIGLAYLEENQLDDAEAAFKKLIDLAPDDATGYANLGLVYLRKGQFDDAEKQLKKAVDIDPKNPGIRLIYAKVFELTDRGDKAVAELNKIIELDPKYAKAYYALAEYFSKSQDEESNAKRAENLKMVVKLLPQNIVPRLQLTELLLSEGKADEALAQMEALRTLVPVFPAEAEEYYNKAVNLLQKNNANEATTPVRIFHNFMKVTSLYQSGNAEIEGPGNQLVGFPVFTQSQPLASTFTEGESILDILKFTDATTDVGLHLGDLPKGISTDGTSAIALADYDGDGDVDVYYGFARDAGTPSKHYLFKNEQGTFKEIGQAAGLDHQGWETAAEFADLDNDGHLDLLIAMKEGDVLYHNNGDGTFSNRTKASKIQDAGGNKILAFDMDQDGDLDVFVAKNGKNSLFRNNMDGTFTEQAEETGLAGGDFATLDAGFGDFDDDGDIDLYAANENAGNVLYTNLRQARFKDITAAAGLQDSGGSRAVAIGDYNNDGLSDIFVASGKNGHFALYRNKGDGTFEPEKQAPANFKVLNGRVGNDAKFIDFDNDGHLDLLVACAPTRKNDRGLFLFHNDSIGVFRDVSNLLPANIPGASHIALADFNEDGDEDIFLTCPDGIHLVRNDGGNLNHFIKVQLVGLSNGNGKNNRYGIGAKLEVRAGDLYQMKTVTKPEMQFGIGNRESADIVRIVWTNGVPQNIISPNSDQKLLEEQKLKGSCPFLYTWNGQKYVFVKDMMWRSALGMPLGIMGGKKAFAFPDISKEYLKIPGGMLQPKDGVYSLNITEELWEAVFFDKASLVAVDHPDSVDVLVDEKFVLPPFPGRRLYKVPKKQIPVAAYDGQGNNLLPLIQKKDDQYVHQFELGKYQGTAAMHDLVLDLGPKANTDSLFLFLRGWIFPTDASINTALSQSDAFKPVAPYLQVLDKKGNWQTVVQNVGFPMGKDKTVVVDLTHKFLTKDRKVRIRTNMQIYWDEAFFSACNPDIPVRMTDATLLKADLHFRGYSASFRKGGRYGPHWFDYYDVTKGQQWRDLTGNYTRYGDVKPLLQHGDDQYVIANAGDELSLAFDAQNLPKLPDGWKRDFLIYSEGWVKDGDFNTAYGQTVKPLPFRAMTSYPYGPEESFPNDQAHLDYERKYNTRKVNTSAFRNAIKEGKFQRGD